MNRTILYYPTIDIPSNTWLRNALIYWDKISSIVPMSYDDNPKIDLNPSVQYLKELEIFRPIRPESLIFQQAGTELMDRFETEFIQALELPNKRKLNFSTADIHRDKITSKKDAKLHNNKVSQRLLDLLQEKNLIDFSTIDREWIQIEQETAMLYMSILAKYLAEINSDTTVVGTDSEIYESINFTRSGKSERIPCFSSILNNVLPSPMENVPFEKIIDFRTQRRDELLEFRTKILAFESTIGSANSIEEIKRSMIQFSEEIELGVNNLEKSFKDAKIATCAKTLKSLVSIKSPTLLSTMAVYAGQVTQIANIPVGLTIAGLGIMGGIELFQGYINGRNERISLERNSSFSYLFKAKRKKIIR